MASTVAAREQIANPTIDENSEKMLRGVDDSISGSLSDTEYGSRSHYLPVTLSYELSEIYREISEGTSGYQVREKIIKKLHHSWLEGRDVELLVISKNEITELRGPVEAAIIRTAKFFKISPRSIYYNRNKIWFYDPYKATDWGEGDERLLVKRVVEQVLEINDSKLVDEITQTVMKYKEEFMNSLSLE